MGASEKADAKEENECPDCLKFGVHTPVEWWKRTRMRYCTFHYWMMKGREGGIFTLDVYIERSQHFGFIVSLPSPEDMAEMTKQIGSPSAMGTMKTLQGLTINPIVS